MGEARLCGGVLCPTFPLTDRTSADPTHNLGLSGARTLGLCDLKTQDLRHSPRRLGQEECLTT